MKDKPIFEWSSKGDILEDVLIIYSLPPVTQFPKASIIWGLFPICFTRKHLAPACVSKQFFEQLEIIREGGVAKL